MLFLQCLCEGVDKTPIKEVSSRSATIKKPMWKEKQHQVNNKKLKILPMI